MRCPSDAILKSLNALSRDGNQHYDALRKWFAEEADNYVKAVMSCDLKDVERNRGKASCLRQISEMLDNGENFHL